MKKLTSVVFAVAVAFVSCEKSNTVQGTSPTEKPANAPETQRQGWGPHPDERPAFTRALSENNLGFTNIAIEPFEVVSAPYPDLTAEQADFYRKFAGIYVSSSLYNSKSVPLTNLQPATMTWGNDYYFLTDLKMIDFNTKTGLFFFASGDRGSDIEDLSTYRLEDGWKRISSPENPLAFVNAAIAARQKTLQAHGIAPTPEVTKKEIWEFIARTLAAVRYLDAGELKGLVSQKYGVSFDSGGKETIANNDVEASIHDILEADRKEDFTGVADAKRSLSSFGSDLTRVLSSQFKVAINQFLNEDIGTFTGKYSGFTLVEILFEGSSEYFSIGLTQENGETTLCYLGNGTSNI